MTSNSGSGRAGKPRTTVIMFQHRFAPKVRDGSKPHTIRPERKRPVKDGDFLSLRQWTDKAYRSPQIILREATCTGVRRIAIGDGVHLDGAVMTWANASSLARADGFEDFDDMLAWFTATHALPFHGVLIEWKP